MKIWITRPQADADLLARAVRGLGHAPLVAPLIRIELHIEGLDSASTDRRANEIPAFTSANGVRAFVAHFDAGGGRVGQKCFAVGAQTAEAARAVGFDEVIMGGGDVASLAEAIRQTMQGLPTMQIVHIVGREQAGDLVQALTHMGIKARKLVLYRAEAETVLPARVGAALADNTLDAVLLYSRRTAQICTALWPQDAPKTLCLCLSSTIAEHCAAAGFATATAIAPTQADMLALIKTQKQ